MAKAIQVFEVQDESRENWRFNYPKIIGELQQNYGYETYMNPELPDLYVIGDHVTIKENVQAVLRKYKIKALSGPVAWQVVTKSVPATG